MTQLTEKIVTKHLQRLRVSVLIVLCFVALGLGMGQPEARPVSAGGLSGLTVCLDPGHGGYDGGAKARDSGRWEKELTLRIARETKRELEKQGARVVLTRVKDVCLSDEGSGKTRKRADLQKRVDIAREAGADVFLSIHLNEYRDRSESGPQVYYQRGGDEGRLLAGTLQEALVEGLRPARERKANPGDYYVLRHSPMPAALVECGFLSNPEEEKQLLSSSYHRLVAQAIASGLQNWWELRALAGGNGG